MCIVSDCAKIMNVSYVDVFVAAIVKLRGVRTPQIVDQGTQNFAVWKSRGVLPDHVENYCIDQLVSLGRMERRKARKIERHEDIFITDNA